MSVMTALHHATQTTATVWVRSVTSGQLSIACEGVSYTGGNVDPSTADGCGVVTITGLSPGREYSYIAYVSGLKIASGVVRTLPATGSTFSIGFSTCFSYLHDSLPLHSVAEFDDLAGFAYLGDQIYTNEPVNGTTVTVNGETFRGVERDNPLDREISLANIYRHYRAYWKHAGMAKMLNKVPSWFIPDDHDHASGNDFDGTIASVNKTFAWATTQQHVTDMNSWCNEAIRAYCGGNPGGSTWYFSVRVNDDVELFFVDGIQYRDNADGTGTTILGAEQKSWLKAGLANSTATWKPVLCGKMFYGGADDFSKYPAERAEMEAFISAQTGWVRPGGVVWLSGDIHYPQSFYNSSAPLACICASPAGSGAAGTVSDGYITHQNYKCTGHKSIGATDKDIFFACGYVRFYGASKMEVGLIDEFGNVRHKFHLLPGSNAVHYDTTGLGL